MSLTPVHTLFQSPYFLPNIPFLSLNPRQEVMYVSHHVSSPPFSCGMISQTALVLDDLDSFEVCWPVSLG